MPINPEAGAQPAQIVPSDSTDAVIAPGKPAEPDSAMPWWVWLGLAWVLIKGLKRR